MLLGLSDFISDLFLCVLKGVLGGGGMLHETFYSDTAHNSKHDELNTKTLFTGRKYYPGHYDGPAFDTMRV